MMDVHGIRELVQQMDVKSKLLLKTYNGQDDTTVVAGQLKLLAQQLLRKL